MLQQYIEAQKKIELGSSRQGPWTILQYRRSWPLEIVTRSGHPQVVAKAVTATRRRFCSRFST